MWKQVASALTALTLVAAAATAAPVPAKDGTQTVSGELSRIVSDDFEAGQSSIRTLLRLDDGKELRLHGAEVDELPGGRVHLTGSRIDDRNFVVEGFQQTGLSRATESSLDSGPQNALVVLTKYVSNPTPAYGLTEIGAVIDATADFWAEDSYGKFSLVPSYVDWTSIPAPPGVFLNQIYPSVIDAVDAQVDFSQIGMLIIVGDLQAPPNRKGEAFLDDIEADTDEGPQNMRVFMLDSGPTMNQAFTEFGVKHELSHTVGLLHSGIYDCGTGPLAASGCNTVGNDTTNVLRPISVSRPAHHLHALQKLDADYIDETQVTTATETGIYTIDPLALPGPGIRGLRLTGQPPLWIEYRQPIGLDVGMDDAPSGQTSTVYDGALITLRVSGQYGSALVDADFGPGSPYDGFAFTLLPGETLEDPFSGASITTVSATPSALTVAVEIDCQDADGDGFGENCLAGPDCDDSDPSITDSGPEDVHIPAGEYLEFGDVRIDEVAYRALDIVNSGCSTLYLLGINSPDPDFFLMNKVLSVPAKSTRTVLVRFTPSALGPDASAITMQTSDADEQWVTVTAVANAVTPEELDFSPGSFSALVPTGGHDTQVLTIENLGGATLSYWIQNQDQIPWLDIAANDALGEVPGFGQKQVPLQFNGGGQCSGTGSVSLRLLSNDDDEFESFIPVTWEVYAAPDLAFNRDPSAVWDFSNPVSSQSLRIDNDGCLPLTIQSIVSSKPAVFSAPFGGPVVVAPGASYTQSVTFNGCPPRGGLAQCGASLSVTTDDPDETSTSFILFGTGFEP